MDDRFRDGAGDTRGGAWRRALLAFVPPLLAAAPALAVDCQLGCRDEQCLVQPADPKEEPKLSRGQLRLYTQCRDIKPLQGQAELRYRHRNRWFTPPQALVRDEPLAKVFDQFPPDDCAALSPKCLQKRANAVVAGVGGHGIDSAASKPGGEGDPCALALPCGRLVPPPPAWRFRLAADTLAGSWTVRPLRGATSAGKPGELTARVERGVVSADGTWFAPGGQYAYRFTDAAGAAVASGEFSLLASAMVERLRGIVARETATGTPEALAWIDALAANSLEWDAYQRSLETGADK